MINMVKVHDARSLYKPKSTRINAGFNSPSTVESRSSVINIEYLMSLKDVAISNKQTYCSFFDETAIIVNYVIKGRMKVSSAQTESLTLSQGQINMMMLSQFEYLQVTGNSESVTECIQLFFRNETSEHEYALSNIHTFHEGECNSNLVVDKNIVVKFVKVKSGVKRVGINPEKTSWIHVLGGSAALSGTPIKLGDGILVVNENNITFAEASRLNLIVIEMTQITSH